MVRIPLVDVDLSVTFGANIGTGCVLNYIVKDIIYFSPNKNQSIFK